ncbi:MAG: hypothetical protein WCE23_05830 [Candidatus Binatus sp.]|uniref:hypothetical protein n=1 Tax=Candidatus Binatus sp. TaxID=2811406 RepID=UPI003C7091F1
MAVERDISPSTNSLVDRMFVATADQDYVLARWAALNHLDLQFLLLGLLAVEKYLKAILLLNGHSAEKYGHNIVTSYEDVLKFYPSLSFAPLVKPNLAGIGQLYWRDEPLNAFIKRLNEMGDPNNRYMLYGFSYWSDDLFKLDQLVWSIRRHCRPFELRLGHPEKNVKIDWVEQLKKQPDHWRIGGNLPVETLLAERTPDVLYEALTKLNASFAPDLVHEPSGWRASSSNPPLGKLCTGS